MSRRHRSQDTEGKDGSMQGSARQSQAPGRRVERGPCATQSASRLGIMRRHWPAQTGPMCYHGLAKDFWHTAFVTPFCHTAAFGQMGVQMITIPELVAQALG